MRIAFASATDLTISAVDPLSGQTKEQPFGRDYDQASGKQYLEQLGQVSVTIPHLGRV